MDEITDSPPNSLSATDRLSERQKQCLELVANGHTSKQIGRILNLSPSTVDNHLNIAVERLGVGSRSAAAQLFVKRNAFCNLSDFKLSQQPSEILAAKLAERSPSERNSLSQSLFSLPPLGGRDNRLSPRRRFYHVVQIMFLALMGFSAAIITIAGIVHLFSERV